MDTSTIKANVKVGVRVRPPLKRELEQGANGKVFNNCIACDDSKIYVSLQDRPVVLSGEGKVPDGVACYTFDNCFDTNSSQKQVYERMVKPSVQSVICGINSTVFAYGQTGTGKTFTMQGDLQQ